MTLKSCLLLLLTLAISVGNLAAEIQSPSQFLGFQLGSDRKLADYRQIVSYFRMLDAASPRVEIENLGKTTLGEEMIMAVISSEENIRNLAGIRETARRLADPRGLTDAQLDTMIGRGKVVVLVTCNIHSTEIGSSQMAMEWAHALATGSDEETRRRLDGTVLLLVPSLNPDGQIMEVEWYRKNLGTRFEGGRMPWLYHHYVGHDNNRDWFMLTQKETRNLTRAIYHRWFPQIFTDEHQMGSQGPRMFVPPFADPLDPDVHPLVIREINLLGSNIALRLEQARKSGVVYGYSFDAYSISQTRNSGWWRNITGLLFEIASARMASPVYVDASELQGGRKGLLDHRAQVNYPNPWKGGWWRLRDVMDYGRIASDALLETAAMYRQDFLRNIAVRARDAIALAKPGEAYRISSRQHDPAAARRLAELFADHGVDVFSSDGESWIPLGQPYGKFVRELMEPQRYPEVRVAREEILEPYDVTAWSLPLMMGVSVELATMPEVSRPAKLNPPILSTQAVEPPLPPRHTREDRQKLRAPRVGLYKPWVASMDEGWTRFVLDQYGFKPVALDNKTIRSGKLREKFDAIILPDLEKEVIATGKFKTQDGAMRYSPELPPEYAGGLEKEGLQALETFVKAGGTLIAFDSATEYVIENFNVPVRNVLATATGNQFDSPGSLLRARFHGDHPVTRGMPAEAPVWLDDNIAFETVPPGSEMQHWVLASYPSDKRDILMSGSVNGVERLQGRAAAVAMTYGDGKIVLFGFRPQHRAQMQATFPLIFNAIYWAVMPAQPPGRQ